MVEAPGRILAVRPARRLECLAKILTELDWRQLWRCGKKVRFIDALFCLANLEHQGTNYLGNEADSTIIAISMSII